MLDVSGMFEGFAGLCRSLAAEMSVLTYFHHFFASIGFCVLYFSHCRCKLSLGKIGIAMFCDLSKLGIESAFLYTMTTVPLALSETS